MVSNHNDDGRCRPQINEREGYLVAVVFRVGDGLGRTFKSLIQMANRS